MQDIGKIVAAAVVRRCRNEIGRLLWGNGRSGDKMPWFILI